MHRCRGKTFNPFTELAFRILSRLKDLGAPYFVNFIKHFCQFDSVTRMLSAPQVVDTSVTFNNSPIQGYSPVSIISYLVITWLLDSNKKSEKIVRRCRREDGKELHNKVCSCA